MTDKAQIPDDHTASRELYDAFVTIGRRQHQQLAPAAPPAPAPIRGHARARRILVLVPIALLTLVAGAGAARVLLDEGPTISGERDLPRELRPAVRDASLATARAADPVGGLPWGGRLYTSAAGGRCAIAGQVSNGALGVMRANRFSPLARDAPGSCTRPGADVLIAAQRSATETGRRSVLFGYVDRSVRSVSIVDAGHSTNVPIASDGSYIAVSASALKGTLVIDGSGRDIKRKLSP